MCMKSLYGVQPVNGGVCGLLSYESPSPPLQTRSSHSSTVLCIVPHIMHHASGVICIYAYDIVYVLSCVRCNGVIYVYSGNMMYVAALCMTYMVYICYIFRLSVCDAPRHLPCDAPFGFL